MEKKIRFDCDNLILEGLVSEKSSEKGAVITHPHPLYGGDMHNPVVETIKEAYLAKGYKTLRFNFRGTGRSEGFHDDGNSEIKDVEAAFNYLRKSGCSKIDLAGYSFGTYVNSMVSFKYEKMIMVAPPVDFIKFREDLKLPDLTLVAAGKNDEFARTEYIENSAKNWNRDVKIVLIDNCNHFFSSSLKKLKEIIIKELK